MKKRSKKAVKKPRRRVRHSPFVRQILEENRFLRKQFHFYQGKCERLELSFFEQKSSIGAAYVARTDQATQPPPKEELPKKLTHAQLQEKWNSMSEKEQDEYIAKGNWNPLTEDAKKKPKARAN